MDDTALIKRACDGDAKAFEDLVNAHYDMIYKVAFKWCGRQQDAEDITQEACIKLARGLDSYRHDAAFTTWLYRLTINAAKDWYKKQNRHNKGSEDGLDTVSVSSKSENKLYAKQVLEEIAKLPEGEKEALLLVVDNDLTHKEAAKLLGVKESTVSWRIHEARKKLSATLEKEQNYG